MGASQKSPALPGKNNAAQTVFAAVAGIFFFISFVKFGDPVILQNILAMPEDMTSAFFEAWPVKIGYWLLAPVLLTGLIAVRWRDVKWKWHLTLPLFWLGWQFLSASQTVNRELTSATLMHFSACVVLFYLGYFSLQGVRNPWPIWAGLGLALCWTIRSGFEQHFGGLEATRKMIEQMKNDPSLPPGIMSDPAYLKRIASSRIFATFSNPDAFAAGLELLLPLTLYFVWQITPKVRRPVRSLFVAILGGCGLAALYWTGSKGAWLVVLIMGTIALVHSTLPASTKQKLVVGIVILGLVGFGIRVATSYHKQQVSVGTRVAYWKAAIQITVRHPLLGTGPGTFSIPYSQVKQPDDDFAKLCHNDYLEQACDSGIPGFLAYGAVFVVFLGFLWVFRIKNVIFSNIFGMVSLGVLGVSLHSVVDYILYFPAIAWPMFFLFGLGMNFKD
jgi:hypothetical protein